MWRKIIPFIFCLNLWNCSSQPKKDTLQDLEETVLEGQTVEAPINDPFLEDPNYTGPLNDQLNPFSKQEKIEDLFAPPEIADGKVSAQESSQYKEEFDSVASIEKDSKDWSKIKRGQYAAQVGPYEEIETIEKLALERSQNLEDNPALESDWEAGKEELSRILDVAPLSAMDLRDFLKKGQKKRKPRIYISNKDLWKAAYNGTIESIKHLMRKGVVIDSQNRRGETALIIAVKRNRFEIVKLLLNAGADRDIKTKKGLNAKTYAHKIKNVRILDLFP
jgi:hypothetical protein